LRNKYSNKETKVLFKDFVLPEAGAAPLGAKPKDSAATPAAKPAAGTAPQPAAGAAPLGAKVAQKVAQGAKTVGKQLGATGGGAQMTKALDQVSQGGALSANLSKKIAPFAGQIEQILADPQLRMKFMQIVKQAAAIKKKAAAAEPPADPVA